MQAKQNFLDILTDQLKVTLTHSICEYKCNNVNVKVY